MVDNSGSIDDSREQENLPITRTIQNLILDPETQTKILLVHNLPKVHGRGSGWAMPGGGEDHRSEAEMWQYLSINLNSEQMNILCGVQEYSKSGINRSGTHDKKIFLSAVKEVIEESNCFALPERLLHFSSRISSLPEDKKVRVRHELYVFNSTFISGEPKPNRFETDKAGWFDLDKLPTDTYTTHFERISFGLETLGLDIIPSYDQAPTAFEFETDLNQRQIQEVAPRW